MDDKVAYRSWDWIIENKIAIGNQSAGKNVELLAQHGITTIVCAMPKLPLRRIGAYQKMGLHAVIHIPLHDAECDFLDLDLLQRMVALVDDALAKDSQVLFHCAAGLSRSVFVATWFLMHTTIPDLTSSRDADSILDLIRRKRKSACPNKQYCMWLNARHKSIDASAFQHP